MGKALNIRNVDDRVYEALRQRAATAGRSVEGEIRAILAETCLPGGAGVWNWADGLRERAQARTEGKAQTDSADLAREARDGR